MGTKGSAPEPVDPAATAGAQTANNIGTAIAQQSLNSVNQITPTGSLQYYIQGANGELVSPADYSSGGVNGGQRPPPPPTSTPTPSSYMLSERAAEDNAYQGGNPYAAPETTQSTPTTQGSTGTGGAGFQYTDPNTGSVYTLPQYTAVQTLSDSEQGIFDANQLARQNLADLGAQQSGIIGDLLGTQLDYGSLPTGGSASNLSMPTYSSPLGLEQLNTDFGSASFSGGIADAGDILRTFGDAGDITTTYGTDFSEDRLRVEEALMSRLNPSLEQDKEALRTSLLNQGIREGSTAYDRAMERADQQSTDARMQAVLAGGQEQSRLADLEAQRAGFENAAQQQQYNQLLGRASFSNAGQAQEFGQNQAQAQLSLQAQIAQQQAQMQQQQAQNQAISGNNALGFQEAMFNNGLQDQSFANDLTMQGRMDQDRSTALQEMFAARNQPINEIGALLGTGQVQSPNFVNTSSPQLANVDSAGIAMQNYQQQMQAYQQQQSMLGGLLGTAGNIGAAFISDRRLKTDIEKVGQHGRLNVYDFKYIGQDTVHTGFMADEVAEIAPEAIVWTDGYAAVNYDMAREAA